MLAIFREATTRPSFGSLEDFLFELEEFVFESYAVLRGEAADAVGAANYSIIKTSPAQRKNNQRAS